MWSALARVKGGSASDLDLSGALAAVAELIEAAQPFAAFNSSDPTIRIEVRTDAVQRLRRALKSLQAGSAVSRRIDVLQVIYGTQCVLAIDLPNADSDNDLGLARELIAEVFAAARAYLDSSDLVDVVITGDRLRAALAACEPTDSNHQQEAIDGICAEGECHEV
ncbi:hypothetical protein D5301_12910 [Stenotrophomonas sp. MH181796]|nr:hypothetical protein [Stenotrophomonas sp. MH181796]